MKIVKKINQKNYKNLNNLMLKILRFFNELYFEGNEKNKNIL